MTLHADQSDIPEELRSDSSPADDDTSAAWRATPQRIGRYELRFELASGGMGSVYLARLRGTAGFEKLVALKRIHPHLARTKRYINMFLDEARIASQITHPNVCSVFDFGEAGGEYYLAMEHLLGEPLSQLLTSASRRSAQRRSPLLPLRVARIIADACEGLHAAHELKDSAGRLLNVVHRDVSPRNLFVTYDGGVQVVDFGLASARERLHHSMTDEMKGSHAYMAPEYIQSGKVDRRTDIWSLGVVMWEMLTLERLFKRDTTANTIFCVLHDEITPPSSRSAQIPRELDAIVMKALERDPSKRWRTAREMGQALRTFLSATKELSGPAELSAWMAELFPDGQARKEQLMDLARLPSAPVLSVPIRGEYDVTVSAGTALSRRPLPQRRKPRRLTGGLLAGAVVAVISLVALVWADLARDDAQGAVAAEATESIEVPSEPVSPAIPENIREADAPPEPTELAAKDAAASDMRAASGPAPAPRKRAARKKRSAELGTISLVTRGGWAEVFKNGESLGSTPKLLNLPPGRHKLLLRPSGNGAPMRIYVDVESGRTKKVSIPLK